MHISKLWHKVQIVRAVSMNPFWCLVGRVKEYSWLPSRWAPSPVQWRKLETRTCSSLPPGGRFQLWFCHWCHSCATAGLRPWTSPSPALTWTRRVGFPAQPTPAPARRPCQGIAGQCLTAIIISGPDPDPCNIVGEAAAPIWPAVTRLLAHLPLQSSQALLHPDAVLVQVFFFFFFFWQKETILEFKAGDFVFLERGISKL